MRKKLEDLTLLEHFNKRIKWVGKKYRYISSGSSRMVYHYSDTLVIKVAKNSKGIAQNEAEFDIWRYAYPNQRKVLAAIVDICPYNTWVLQKKVDKKLKPYSKQAKETYKNKKDVFKELESLGFNNGDTKRSLGTSKKGVVCYDYGLTDYILKQYYRR